MTVFNHIAKEKNLAAVLGGMAALLGMFLPYVEGVSFFQSLSGPEYGFFAAGLTLMIASATALYALGLVWLPQGISIAVLVLCLLFPGYACWTYGFGIVLSKLRAGAWVLFTGLLIMTLSPFSQMVMRHGKTSHP